ncbi:MAG TPA: WD40 repeat domain-containing protein [Gemmataceae bacterium]|nr:WD40 repeat domain-containing protein [Gemmataceae bacterium]
MCRPYRCLVVALALLAGHAFSEGHSPTPKPKQTPATKPSRLDFYGDPLPPGAVARLGSLRLRHYGIQDFTFSRDGKMLISAGSDQFVRFWDAATGKPVRATRLQGKNVQGCVAISPDGTLYAVSDSITTYVWETATGKEVKRLTNPRRGLSANYVYFSPDNKTLAIGTNLTTLTLWDWKAGKSRELTVPSQQPRRPGMFFAGSTSCQASFSPDSKLLATGTTTEDELAIWDVAAGKIVQSLDAHAVGFAFSPDNKLIAVTSQAGGVPNLRVYEVATGKEVLHTPLPNQAGTPSSYSWVTWSPDGKTILPADYRGSYLIDRRTGKQVRRLQGPGLPGQRELYFSPDGKTIAGMGSGSNRLRLWDAATGKELLPHLGSSGEADSAAYSRDGRRLATGTAYGGGVDVWDVATGRPVHALDLPGGNRAVEHVSFSDDGRTLVAGLQEGTLEYYDIATGKLRRKLELNKLRKQRLQFVQFQDYHVLPGGQRVLSLEWIYNPQQGSQVSVWDTNPGRLVNTHTWLTNQNRMGFVGNNTPSWATFGDGVAVRTNSGITIIDGNTGMAHLRIKGNWGTPLAASPDGRFVAAPEPGQGGPRQYTTTIFMGGAGGVPANVIVDASNVMSTTTGGVIHVWETATGKEVAKLPTGAVHSLALAGDDRTLVTAGTTALHIWDVPTGKQRGQIPLPADLVSGPNLSMVLSLHLSPDGRHVATPVRSGTVLIWELPKPPSRPTIAHLDDKVKEHLWEALSGEDAAKAYGAIWRLAEAPGPAVALLRAHVKPVSEGDPKRVQKLLADLDHKRFRVRESATHELSVLGNAVLPEIRKALEGKPSPEARRRLQLIFTQAGNRPPSPDTICHLRAVQVLEQVGTDEARALLQSLAAGVAITPETRAARAALDRLQQRNSAGS